MADAAANMLLAAAAATGSIITAVATIYLAKSIIELTAVMRVYIVAFVRVYLPNDGNDGNADSDSDDDGHGLPLALGAGGNLPGPPPPPAGGAPGHPVPSPLFVFVCCRYHFVYACSLRRSLMLAIDVVDVVCPFASHLAVRSTVARC